jgi:hypothetical protein
VCSNANCHQGMGSPSKLVSCWLGPGVGGGGGGGGPPPPRRPPAATEPLGTGAQNAAVPWLLHAHAVAGGGLSEARLRRLAFRVLLRTRAGQVLPVLLPADLASDRPGMLVDAPVELPLPPGAPDELAQQWPLLLGQVDSACQSLESDLDTLLAALPRDGDGELALAGLPLPQPDDDDRWALVDEAMAEAALAAKSGEPDRLEGELALWTRAARVMLGLDGGPDLDATEHRALHQLVGDSPSRRAPVCTIGPPTRSRASLPRPRGTG